MSYSSQFSLSPRLNFETFYDFTSRCRHLLCLKSTLYFSSLDTLWCQAMFLSNLNKLNHGLLYCGLRKVRMFAIHDICNTTQYNRQGLPDKKPFYDRNDAWLVWLEQELLHTRRNIKEAIPQCFEAKQWGKLYIWTLVPQVLYIYVRSIIFHARQSKLRCFHLQFLV